MVASERRAGAGGCWVVFRSAAASPHSVPGRR